MEDKLPFDDKNIDKDLKSKKGVDEIMLGVGILLFMLIIVAIVIFGIEWHNVEKKAKNVAENQIRHSITNEDVTPKEIIIDNVESIKFKSREEDPVGFFKCIEKESKITDTTGVTYNSYLEYYRATVDENYDPEQGNKIAYIITGTYTATHIDNIDIDGEFRIVYVSIGNLGNQLCMVEQSHWGSDDMLKNAVINQVTGHLIATYDIQPNPEIEITYVEKDRYNDFYTDYVVYGKATVKDKFGEEFTMKFTAEYQYNDSDQYFEKQSMEIDEPVGKITK